MNHQDYLKSIPKVEVSFQDDFTGTERDVVLTPRYINSKIKNDGYNLNIGDKILLWEKDKSEDEEHYICNIGEVVNINEEVLSNYPSIKNEDLNKLDNGDQFMIKINDQDYFNLPIDTEVFSD